MFENLKAVAETAGRRIPACGARTIYLTDLGDFAKVNEIMAEYFNAPYPARATVGVASLPRNARVEVDAVMVVRSRLERHDRSRDARRRR